MSKVYTSIDQLIGHTPLLELTHFEADEDLKARVLVKLEYFNPAGSVKDRVAKNAAAATPSSSPRAATPASASPRWRRLAATR